MHDNKVRLSQDVLEKAERIANEWGLKNTRAAVEAVFRKYCDDYLYGRSGIVGGLPRATFMEPSTASYGSGPEGIEVGRSGTAPAPNNQCEALDALDQLLAL
ncbi:hypothetical protein [Nodosilinea sp. P-1105]|uniref:hypothetical protein n=1 Tax=Nodosilinea sp. P-1105 TaxID=2546229 RepID=UPI00146B19E5|nr:hypothetical protein [Nodosilinea sp. P-1105]NMF85890.1 hypothetical protein [Nodosilinea sp. P-1105]